LMIVSHGSGHVSFNEMLPSSHEENGDLHHRYLVMERAVLNLQRNVPLSQCGDKVIEKARKMSVPLQTGIRTFMASQISGMSPEKRSGRPGYVLNNSENQNIAEDQVLVAHQVDDVFSDRDLHLSMFIQPPNKASQLLSHIHGFLLPKGPLPEKIDENYVNVDLIRLLQQDKLTARAISDWRNSVKNVPLNQQSVRPTGNGWNDDSSTISDRV
jgi:hypothetical protein